MHQEIFVPPVGGYNLTMCGACGNSHIQTVKTYHNGSTIDVQVACQVCWSNLEQRLQLLEGALRMAYSHIKRHEETLDQAEIPL